MAEIAMKYFVSLNLKLEKDYNSLSGDVKHDALAKAQTTPVITHIT
jgi:hypothetical protein